MGCTDGVAQRGLHRWGCTDGVAQIPLGKGKTGTDQGKLGNMHALGIISETAGSKMGELGTTTFRPPYTPLTFGTIVGRNVGEYFDIFRKTPIHEWHVKNKAEFENVGQWKRAWYYPQNGESMKVKINTSYVNPV